MSHLDRVLAKQTAEHTTQTPARPLRADQEGVPDTSDLRTLLHTPGVHIAPDEQRQAVVIVLPVDIAYEITGLCPDPLQAHLACQLVTDPDPDLLSRTHR